MKFWQTEREKKMAIPKNAMSSEERGRERESAGLIMSNSCTSISSRAPWDSHAKWACASQPAVGVRMQDAREAPLPSLSTPPAKTCRPLAKAPASQHMLIHNKESPAQSAELWNHLKSTAIYIYSFGGPRCLEREREWKEGERKGIELFILAGL